MGSPKFGRWQYWADLAAKTDPRSQDVFNQAPILLKALTEGHKMGCYQHRLYFCRVIGETCWRGDRLKHIFKKQRIAPQFRVITASNLSYVDLSVARLVSREVKASTLAQAIPPKSYQRTWLYNLAAWSNGFTRRGRSPELLPWAVVKLQPKDIKPHRCADLVDYYLADRGGFGQDRTLRNLLAAMDDWHVEKTSRMTEGEFVRRYGVSRSFEVPYGRNDHAMSVGDYEFEPLRSANDLEREAKVMHHCVSSYFPDIFSGSSRLFSIRQGGRNVATLQATCPPMKPVQLKGPCNRKVSTAVNAAVREFCKMNSYAEHHKQEGE